MAVEEKKDGYRAVTRYLIASPFKIRPVAKLIRRKPYPEAISLLENMPQRGARILKKTVKSAASNALNLNKQLDEDMLYVKEVLIDEGPRMKRVWFRARGRADMLLKRLCHVTVVIDETGKAKTAGKSAKAKVGE